MSQELIDLCAGGHYEAVKASVEGGANVFLGESDTSFFGQFKHNSNVYAALRMSF